MSTTSAGWSVAAGSNRTTAGGTVDTAIYPMPAFVALGVADVARSMRWYTDGLWFLVLA